MPAPSPSASSFKAVWGPMMPSRLRHWAGRAEARENELPEITGSRVGIHSDALIDYFGNA